MRFRPVGRVASSPGLAVFGMYSAHVGPDVTGGWTNGLPARDGTRPLLRLVALGYAPTALDTHVDVILSFYGLLFLAVLPLYRLRAATLALIAASGALILPQVLYAIQKSIDEGNWADAVLSADPLARGSGTDGVVELLFTGEYPVTCRPGGEARGLARTGLIAA